MIIVSQDKDSIINFDTTQNIWIDEISATFRIYANVGILGKYATEERAKEVLEEIVEQYEHEKDCKCDRGYLATLDNFTYRMPKE